MSDFATSEASIDWNGLLELGLLFSVDKSPVRDIIALEPIQPGPSSSPICCVKKNEDLQPPLESEPSTLVDLLDLPVPTSNTDMTVPPNVGVPMFNTGLAVPASNTTNAVVPVFKTGIPKGIPVPVRNTGVSVFMSVTEDRPYLVSTSSVCTNSPSSQVGASLQPSLLVSSSTMANPQSVLAVRTEDPEDLRSRCNSGSSLSDRISGDDYRKRRQQNNIAVRRSRQKAKERSQQKQEELKRLALTNERLKKRCSMLEEEVKLLRTAHSMGHQQNPLILEKLRNMCEKGQRFPVGDSA